MKKCITMTLMVGLMAGVAQAALQADWGASGVVTVTDASGDSGGSTSTDILSLQSAYQDGGYYFLMTLAAAPSDSSYAPAYMINIDNVAGGAGASASFYVGAGLSGIDMIVDSHYAFSSGHVSQHQHDFIGGTTPQFNQEALGDTGGLFNTSVDGTQLEWFVPASLLGQGASVYASTLTAAPSPGNVTYDTTLVALVTPVPEPTSMALLVLGVIALGLRRKRS